MARTTRTDASREAVIGRSTRVRGRVDGDGDLRVEGELEGDVALRGDLTVEDGGRLTSRVDAQEVTVRGAIEGDVRARSVHVEAGGRIRGDITSDAITIEEGAEIAGRLEAEFDLPAELAGAGGGGRRR